MNSLIAWFARQRVLVEVVFIAVIAVGLASIFNIKREVFPVISFDAVAITTLYPGASADSVERLVTNPIELALREVEGIKNISSVTNENFSVVTLEVDPDETTAERAKDDAQDVIDSINDLPADIERPRIIKLENRLSPVVRVALTGDLEPAEIRRVARRLERELENVPAVAKVDYEGLRAQEIQIEAKPALLREFDVTLADVIRAVSGRNVSIPGGTIEVPPGDGTTLETIVRTVADYEGPEDVAQTVIRANALARPIRVSDVATVSAVLEREKSRVRTDGSNGLILTVVKKEAGDAISLVDNVRKRLEELKPSLDSRLTTTMLDDQSFLVRRRISVLASNFAAGFVLVVIVLSLMLPFRIAMITAVGIPLCFFGTFIIFDYADISLNLLSLLGLIIVLGMLVDDAIVTTENAQRYLDMGLSPEEAAIKGTQEIWAPVTGAVLTTVAAFLPLAFMSGIFGKFVRQIPLGVIIALGMSLLACFFMVPNHIATYVRAQREMKPNSWARFSPRLLVDRVWNRIVAPAYGRFVEVTIRWRWGVVTLATLLFVFSVWWGKEKIPFVLFPPGNIDQFIVNIETPVGTPLERLAGLVAPVERAVLDLPKGELMNTITRLGTQSRGGPGGAGSRRGTHLAQVAVYLTQQIDRERTAQAIMDGVRDKVGKPDGIKRISFNLQRGGPPVGKPVNVGIRGENYKELIAAAEELKTKLGAISGVTDIEDNFIPGKDELHVRIRESEAAAARLSPRDVGTAVRAAFEGVEATTITRLEEEIKVRVTLARDSRSTAETIGQLAIPNAQGNLIRLDRVATIERFSGVSVYEHEDGQRQVEVRAEVKAGEITSQQANKILRETAIPELRKNHPDVQFVFGGEQSDTNESLGTLRRAFVLALLGIFLLLVVLFRNIYQPIAVVTTIPLGIVAVIWTFWVHDRPLSFLAIVGIVALAGVVVNNAIVMIDFVNIERAAGMDRWRSISEAASTRLRPIFLTSVTTVLGCLPTAYGIGGLDPFIVPVALALGWGVGIGALLTVLIFPSVIGVFDDGRAVIGWCAGKLLGSKQPT